MEYVTDFFRLKMLCNGSKREAIWLWLALSVWLPFVISGVIIAVCFLVILLDPDSCRVVREQKNMFRLGCCIGALSFLSAITVGNIVGVAVAIGIFVEVICGCRCR